MYSVLAYRQLSVKRLKMFHVEHLFDCPVLSLCQICPHRGGQRVWFDIADSFRLYSGSDDMCVRTDKSSHKTQKGFSRPLRLLIRIWRHLHRQSGGFIPFSATCAAKTEPSRKGWIPFVICRPVNPAGFIGKSCKTPEGTVIARCP